MSAPLTITTAAAALRAGSLTAVELAESSIAVAERLDEAVGVYIARYDEQLLEAAAAADADLAAGRAVGPLHGIPLGIKDIITTTEGETTGQSLVLDRSWASGDAVVVQRLREAGGLIAGKLTTMEFASGAPDPEKPFPICRNPWNLDHWPGGSSSGTGSGLATGMFLGGLGTDTGGSIRMPAVWCGITGLMPTFGRVPKSGCVPLGYSLDHIGPMARSAADCALMLQCLAGYDASDLTSLDVPVPDYVGALTGDLAGMTIGVDRTSGRDRAEHVDEHLDALLDAAVLELTRLGATVVEVTLPHYETTLAAAGAIGSGERQAYHLPDVQTRLLDYSASLRVRAGAATHYSAADYVQGQRVRRVVQRAVATLFEDVDLVLTPTSFQVAPTLDQVMSQQGWFRSLCTQYWDVTGHPVISLPVGFGEGGLPLAMQLVGRPFEETTVLRAAEAFQRDTTHHLHVPTLVTEPTEAAA